MSESSILARWFLMGGGALALVGFILWFALPVQQSFPPYLSTALLALGYGLFCLLKNRHGGAKP